MKKNHVIQTEIIDNGINFEGIAKIDDIPVFVPYAIKDEVADIKIVKVNKNFAYGKIENLLTTSKYRITTICKYYSKCGGCDAMHIEYEKTLDIKRKNVINTLKKMRLQTDKVEDIYGMGIPYNYRNKAQYPVRNINNKTIMGMFSKRSHNIIKIDECYIQNKLINEVAKNLFNVLIENGFIGYDEQNKNGDIKHIMIRIGSHTREIMCVIVANHNITNKIKQKNIVSKIIAEYVNIKSVILNINEKDSNTILSNKNIIIYGKEYISDYIGRYKFNISANSFFQINTTQAELLYNILKKSLNLSGKENLLELYSGVGSIGIFLSDSVKSVLGIEIVKEAVNNSLINIDINNIKNVKYICGDATKEIEKITKNNFKYDVLVIDPPRKGLDEDGINAILKLKPKKIGYISCNIATLARDLKILQQHYNIKNINIVDMFPWTSHVEVITILNLKH